MIERTLRSVLLDQIQAGPDRPALVVKDQTLTFGDLDRTARTIAAAIVDRLARPAARVGIFASRSQTAYTGVLSALYAGGTFVPLNPTFPPARTRAMVESAGLDAIIVDGPSSKQIAAVLGAVTDPPLIVSPDATDVEGVHDLVRPATLAELQPLDTLPDIQASDVAYLLFTSGSTGTPKGVPVTHANALHFLDFVTDRYRLGPQDRFSQTFDQTFDLSVFDQFAAWMNGACVYALQPLDLLAPARFVGKHGLTVWFSVPSIAALMRKKGSLKPGVFPTLRLSLFCGEPLPRQSAEAWQEAAPHSVVENLYGPTELTIACLVHRWTPDSAGLCVNDVVPIGTPFAGLTALVLDELQRVVASGEAGELCVAGPQTVPGYWNDPVRTAAAFITVKTPDGLEDRFYRTGDRVRQLPGGDYVYLGRTDHQVKVLGHRVELGEIEGQIARQPGVTQVAAMGWPVTDGSAEGIIAFVAGTHPDAEAIRTGVRRVLPDYMAPRTVVVLEALPLNANGKVDRKALLSGLETGQYLSAASAERT